MNLFNLFGRKADTPPQAPENNSCEEDLEIYSGMRVEVTDFGGRFLFVAKLMGLRGNQAELHQYLEAAVSQTEEPFPVRIRGYSDRDRKAVYMEGVISSLPQNKWSVTELKLCWTGNDRAFFRLDTNLDATATMFSGLAMGEKPCKLLNISIGGASIRSKAKYYEGDKFLLKISLMDNGPESAIYSEVKRVIEKDYGEFEYGCQFLELRDDDQEKITKNIFDAQCQNRRR